MKSSVAGAFKGMTGNFLGFVVDYLPIIAMLLFLPPSHGSAAGGGVVASWKG